MFYLFIEINLSNRKQDLSEKRTEIIKRGFKFHWKHFLKVFLGKYLTNICPSWLISASDTKYASDVDNRMVWFRSIDNDVEFETR